jgi:hypothetical protein
MRPILPGEIRILNVALGDRRSSDGGLYAMADANVTVRIVGDSSGVFRVVKVETADVVITQEGPHGGPIASLQTALTASGPGPIQVFSGQAILASVEFSCPSDPAQAIFRARADLDGLPPQKPNGLSILATANLGMVAMDIVNPNPSILPGQTENIEFQISSSLGHDVNVAVEIDRSEPNFSAPTPSLFVPKGAIESLTIPITCAPGTPVGRHGVEFQLRNIDRPQVWGGFNFGITVTRSVQVVTSLPSDLQLQQGDSVRGEIRVTLTGEPAQFEVDHGPLPLGVSVSPNGQRMTVDSTGFVGFDINVATNAPLGKFGPLSFFWTVREPEITGQLVFDLEITSDVEEILYDSGTLEANTVRGWAQLAVHKNGDWFYRGHVHENGVVGDNYAFAIAFKPVDSSGDLLYVISTHSLGGTVDPFHSRDDDWQQSGNDPRITQNWDNIKRRGVSAFTSRLHAATEAVQVVEAVIEGLVVAIPAAFVASFLTSPDTKCDDPVWEVRPGDREGVQEGVGVDVRVRCHRP